MPNATDSQNKLKLVEIEPGWYIEGIDANPWYHHTDMVVQWVGKEKLIQNVQITSNLADALNFWQADHEELMRPVLRSDDVIPSFPNAKIVYINLVPNAN
ncbi:hypothetical protein [uncultured Weissella sp.]|uniref:hypothetical protein n=1 Tax=uncultured Weissella sp. TaxID=253243 RepID=UPI0025856C07|nr:hypothetical protein [uncultured Weissella sp.]